VIRSPAAEFIKQGNPAFKNIKKSGKGGYGFACRLPQLRDIFGETFLVDIDGFVRPEGRKYPGFGLLRRGGFAVPFQSIRGIVGGPYRVNLEFFEDPVY